MIWWLLAGFFKVLLWTLLQVDPVSAGVQYDKEFTVCSLDLLSGLAEGLGSGIESLVIPFSIIILSSLNYFISETAHYFFS